MDVLGSLTSPPALILLGVLLVMGVMLLFMRSGAENAAAVDGERLARLRREAENWTARAREGLKPIATRLILKNDEHALLEEPTVLVESRAYRLYGGGGTKIGRFYVGGGASESQQRLKQIDEGTLTLTTKRIIFDGTHENRNVLVSQVLSVSPWADAIEVSTQRRAKSQVYRVANPLIWAAAVQAVAKGDVSERHLTDTT